jgi:hypothetical protein
MPVENRGTAKRPRWRYAFTIRGVRYRASIPEARTKYEAEQAEVEAKKAIFEGRYGRPSGEVDSESSSAALTPRGLNSRRAPS